MQRNRRNEIPVDEPCRPAPTLAAASRTLGEVNRHAEQALRVRSRIVAPDQHLDLSTEGGSAYRVRAIAGDALVIQHRSRADTSPFSGLLVTKAAIGMPPRVLFDMGPLVEGSAQVGEAWRMLDAVVQHASLR